MSDQADVRYQADVRLTRHYGICGRLFSRLDRCDALGINKIERLPGFEPPHSYSKARSDDLAYVIENQADMGPGRVSVMFKVTSNRPPLPLAPPLHPANLGGAI